jgi:hypothetical protein
MSRSTRSLFTAATIATLAYGLWSVTGADHEGPTAESAELMVNHLWIDRLPVGERDMVHYFLPVTNSHGRFGAAGRASRWRQLADHFAWSLEDDRLALFFGQEQVHWQPNVRAWRCDQDGFELCLELWDDHHKVSLYSRDEWVVEPDATAVPEALARALPAIADMVADVLDEHGVDAPAGHAEATALVLWTE